MQSDENNQYVYTYKNKNCRPLSNSFTAQQAQVSELTESGRHTVLIHIKVQKFVTKEIAAARASGRGASGR
jgi:hypothetical protein